LLEPVTWKASTAEYAGAVCPDGMQRLLRMAGCDASGVRDDLRAYDFEHPGWVGWGVVGEVVPGFVEFEVAVPPLSPAVWGLN
jgi:hypothetical protein